MKAIGAYLKAVVERNPTSFRMFSPDELASNKLDAVFDVVRLPYRPSLVEPADSPLLALHDPLPQTHRCMQWDPETANNGGRVIEMLSEHTLQGLLQGYTITGRTGLFPSYESFLGASACPSPFASHLRPSSRARG